MPREMPSNRAKHRSVVPEELTHKVVGYGRRREFLKSAERPLRNATPQQPPDASEESVLNRGRVADAAYKKFLRVGSHRTGTHTARETGARDMAVEKGMNEYNEVMKMRKNKFIGGAKRDQARRTV